MFKGYVQWTDDNPEDGESSENHYGYEGPTFDNVHLQLINTAGPFITSLHIDVTTE